MAKALEFDKIKPLKLFSKSLPLKSESGKAPKRDTKSSSRETSPVPLSGGRKKIANSAPVTGRSGPSITDSKALKTVQMKKCAISTTIVQNVDNIVQVNNNCSKSEFEVSLTLSVATDLPDNENQFYPQACCDQKKKQQQNHIKVDVLSTGPSIPGKIELITKSTTIYLSSSPSVTISKEVASRTGTCDVDVDVDGDGDGELALEPIGNLTGRDSPTLSELSQEDQYQHTDSESDNTEIFIGNEVLNSNRQGGKNINNIQNNFNIASHDNDIRVVTHSMEEKNIDSNQYFESASTKNGINLDSSADSGRGEINTPNSPLRWRRGQAIGEGTFGRVYKGE